MFFNFENFFRQSQKTENDNDQVSYTSFQQVLQQPCESTVSK